jgi:hypothetical protein
MPHHTFCMTRLQQWTPPTAAAAAAAAAAASKAATALPCSPVYATCLLLLLLQTLQVPVLCAGCVLQLQAGFQLHNQLQLIPCQLGDTTHKLQQQPYSLHTLLLLLFVCHMLLLLLLLGLLQLLCYLLANLICCYCCGWVTHMSRWQAVLPCAAALQPISSQLAQLAVCCCCHSLPLC